MPKRRPKAKAPDAPLMKRKNFFVDQRKLDRARVSLGLDSETATIDAALDRIVFADEFMVGIESLRDAGGLEYFEKSDEPDA
jgi:hypothetical protein